MTFNLKARLEEIGGCGDGGCIVHVRPGMHTNGGCRCNRDPLKMVRVIWVYKLAMSVRAEALTKCEVQFLDYESQHRAKGTPEADAKAKVNADMAAMIDTVLDNTR